MVSHIEDFRRGVAMVLQVLEDRLEQERLAQHGAILAAVSDAQIRAEAQVRDIQAQADAEQEKLRKLLEAAEAQIVGERGQLQEQAEQLRGQVASLQTERDRLAAQLAQAERLREAAERRSQHKAARAVEPVRLRQIAIVDQIFADFRGINGGQLPGQSVLGAPPAIQAAAGEAPISSGAAQDAIVPFEARQPVKDLPAPLPERKDETRPGVWRRILNFVLSK